MTQRNKRKKPIYTKWWFIAFCVLFIAGGLVTLFDNEKDEPKEGTTQTTSEQKKESISSEKWVKQHTGKDFDKIIADFNTLKEETQKNEINAQVADDKKSMFGKKVNAVGEVTEFLEGFNGLDGSSFMMTTQSDNKVRVSLKNANNALDVGETVEVNGLLASPLTNPENFFIREATGYIK